MEVQSDFKDLLALFNAHKVDYIIIGAYALAFHGAPRYTGDLDLLVCPDRENAKRILNALDVFGFGAVGLTIEDFTKRNKVVQLGVAPVRIDIMTSITGVTWQEVKHGRNKGSFGDISVYYIGKQQFITNKRALGRKKDLADLEALGEE